MHIVGTLDWQPALDHPELLGRPVRVALAELGLKRWKQKKWLDVARLKP